MPDYIMQNGQTASIPGVVEIVETVMLGEPGPSPTFAVPMLLGSAPSGKPYNFDSVKQSGESSLGAFTQYSTDAAVSRAHGYGSDIAIAFRNAQVDGLPTAFIANIAPLTRASVPVASTGPVEEFTLYSRLFGAPGGHNRVKFSSGVLTITPVKAFALLSAAVTTTSTRIYVQGQDGDNSPISWMSEGSQVFLGDSDTADFAVTVLATGRQLDSNGQWQYYFDISAAAGTAVEISTKYGMVVLFDDPEISPTFSSGEGQKIIDWVNANSKVFAAQALVNFSGALPISVSASTSLKDLGSTWGTVVPGTSPAAASSDWQTFWTNYAATYWDQFRSRYSLIPRAHLILSSSSTVHGYARAFAVAKRRAGTPVLCLVSTAFTDTVLTASDDTSPIYRARALNHQDMVLFAGQCNELVPYLTLAASAFGQLIAGGSRYSITRKGILGGGNVRIKRIWDEANLGELTSLAKAGVVTYLLSPSATPSWQFAIGVNTLQSRATTWSPSANATCMIAARNCIDEFRAGLVRILDSFAGNTALTALDLGAAISAYCRQARDQLRLVKDFGAPAIEGDSATGSLRVTALSVNPPDETLFLGLFLNIIVK